jgi:hypothetical protein
MAESEGEKERRENEEARRVLAVGEQARLARVAAQRERESEKGK